MTEGAARKFDVKNARNHANGFTLGAGPHLDYTGRMLLDACDRIEALEKVAWAAEAYIVQVNDVEAANDSYEAMKRRLKAAGYLRALEGSPE